MFNKLKSFFVGLLVFAFFMGITMSSCSGSSEKSDAVETTSEEEHPEEGGEHPEDSEDEHPSDGGDEHPSDGDEEHPEEEESEEE
jgi:hypothetical protein